MNIGDCVVVAEEKYQVLASLGGGGQGSVWRVRRNSDRTEWVLKILNESDCEKRLAKVNNIRHLISEKADRQLAGKFPNVEHVCPLVFYSHPTDGSVGYIMECARGRSLDKILCEQGLAGMPLEKKLRIAEKVAQAIDAIHSIGYCYTDISWGNFIWDDASGTLSVIDCENMADKDSIERGACSFLIGTGFFMAPEVAFGRGQATYFADRYALATLIFRLMTNNVLESAYHGRAMYTVRPACLGMSEVAEAEQEGEIDPGWRHFVFDPNDRSNGIEDVCRGSKNPDAVAFRTKLDEVQALWDAMDGRLKQLFYTAFADPFDREARPLASTWASEIGQILLDVQSGKAGAAKNGRAKAPAAGNAAAQIRAGSPAAGSGGAAPAPAGGATACAYKPFVPQGRAAGAAPPAAYKPFVPQGAGSAGMSAPPPYKSFVPQKTTR